jgi:signal transduction histidine kinase
MVRTYTLHVPASAEPGDPEALEKAELVKDGFAWGAFLFTFLWFFWNRLWLAGLLVLVLVVGLLVAMQALRVDAGAAFLAQLLLSLLIGLEATSLQRWTLRRRKPAVDLVAAASLAEAEAKSFARWLQATRPRAGVGATAVPVMPLRAPDPVVGLFPNPERTR